MLQGALPSPSGKGKRQAHAERVRAASLSHMLSTRLRYAVFKVENGWTRQSLSEVENLFYRRQVNLSKPGPDMKTSPNVLDNNKRRYSPASPSLARRDDMPVDMHYDTTSYAEFWSRIDTSRNHSLPQGAEPVEQTKEAPVHAGPTAPAAASASDHSIVHSDACPSMPSGVPAEALAPPAVLSVHPAKHALDPSVVGSDDMDLPHFKRTRT